MNLSSLTINDILACERIVPVFQPILATRNRSIVGYEGLIRSLTKDGRIVSPADLFDSARACGVTLHLDRLCRDKVLAAFRPIHQLHKNCLLFLNLDVSFISADVVGSGYLRDQVIKHRISPSSIVIEIVESKNEDTDALIRFVRDYREQGFNIALDDVGTGHSNFDRIFLLRPNIIKIDRSIISGIGTNYFKQEIFRSLSRLSKSVGCLTLAEGVETQQEALGSIEFGADLMQGYFFSRPKNVDHLASGAEELKLKDVLSVFRKKQIDVVKSRRMQSRQYQKTILKILRAIEGKSLEEANAFLEGFVETAQNVDALYIVNHRGIQITDTLMKKGRQKIINPIFRAASKNENLFYKEYIYQLINNDLKKYTTDRYISFATGNLCVTLSHIFRGAQNRRCVLCVDFLAPVEETPK